MKRREYDSLVGEYFDITHEQTRTELLSFTEDAQNQVMSTLATRLYEKIVAKITDIDFGIIPQSRGDITKIPNYLEMKDCLNIIRDLQIEAKQSTSSTDTILSAIENIKSRTDIWQKGYHTDSEFVAVYYNVMCLSVVSATSLLISTSIDFIKDPDTLTFNATLAKARSSRTQSYLLFDQLEKFNIACSKGDIDKTMNAMLTAKRSATEAACGNRNTVLEFGAFSAVFGALIVIFTVTLPLLRYFVYFLYNTRQKLSDYLAAEADVVILNAENIKYQTAKSDSAKKAIADKQRKVADRLRSLSNKLQIKLTKVDKEVTKQISDDLAEDKKLKITDVMDTLPDSAATSLF